MKNCVTHPTNRGAPVYFIELDGQTKAFRRERKTTIIGFDRERPVANVGEHPRVEHRSIRSILRIRDWVSWIRSMIYSGNWVSSMRAWI